jgi:hypothetical protein
MTHGGEEVEGARKILMELADKHIPDYYSNYLNVWGNPLEVVLTFGRILPGAVKLGEPEDIVAEPLVRVTLTPEVAKGLLQTLEDHVKKMDEWASGKQEA